MKVIADLHIHSPYSRATSKDISIQNLEKYARIKGLDLLGTGDFTHPSWLKILKETLIEGDSGVLKTKSGFNFILSSEISNIYTQGDKQRRVHNLILAPSFDIVDHIIEELKKRGRVDYDGRPIFGFSCIELVEMMMDISKDIEIIPAHAWTSWFSVFGSKSGFDSLEECFQDKVKFIHAIETGLSSDPSMNWRISKLDDITLVSFSDSHSAWPWRLGREATVFDLKELTYDNLIKAIRTKEGLVETLEFFPEEGKYHWDGHRNCNISLRPSEAIKLNNICPVCRKPLTIGVLHRVEELADRPEGFVPKNSKPFKSLIPLSEIIAFVYNVQPFSRKVWEEYNRLINIFDSELNVLLGVEESQLRKVDERIAELVMKVRYGDVKIRPGYDGVYGKVVFEKETEKSKPQKTLKDF
jgi:uncharacterized protein (TIGR00375 family)